MATKHNIVGQINISKIEGRIIQDNGVCNDIRFDRIVSLDENEFNDGLELLVNAYLKSAYLRIKGVERKGRVKTKLPIVINDIKEIKVK